MRRRNWGIVILVNVVVSAAVVLAVLLIWDRVRTRPPSHAPATPLPAASDTGQPLTPATGVTLTPEPEGSGESTHEYVTYVVQEGDTLSAIAAAYGVSIEELVAFNHLADPNVLHPGQTLTIPLSGSAPAPAGSAAEEATEPPATASAVVTPLPTPTSSGPPLIEIAKVLGSGNLASEVVVVRNRGGVGHLKDWKLSDAAGNTFTFPALTLYTDAEVRVHTGQGANTPTDLYWNRAAATWSGGELITLRDASGSVVDTYIVP